MKKDKAIVNELIKKIKGDFTEGGAAETVALKAFDMGKIYAGTNRFENSTLYRNYKVVLDDGSQISSNVFFQTFMARNQTSAYMEAERILREFFDDPDEVLFHLVRDKRRGINGIFKAIKSQSEPQRLSYTDYLLTIACFGAGVMGTF